MCFVKNHDVFDWWARINQRIITKVVNVLNEGFDTLANFCLPNFFALFLSASYFVTGESFVKHSDQ